MNHIDMLFRRLRKEGRKAFIPFLTAGDPDLAATEKLLRDLALSGAHLIEIGFPYSDPIADGPVIQASYTRALNRGIRVDDIFQMAAGLSHDPAFAQAGIPRVGMISYSRVQRRGRESSQEQARAAGLSGAIVPDLPIDEADEFA